MFKLKKLVPKKIRRKAQTWRQQSFPEITELQAHLREARGIVHIGAHEGQERYVYRRLDLDVLWVEGNPNVFAKLRENVADFPKQKAVQALLSEDDGTEVPFYVSSNNGLSSSILDFSGHTEFWPDITMSDRMMLPTKRFETVIAENDIDLSRYDAMALDVQGAEAIVLRGIGDLLRKFRWLTIETSDKEIYAGGQTWTELEAYLQSFGFREVARNIFRENDAMGACFDVILERRA